MHLFQPCFINICIEIIRNATKIIGNWVKYVKIKNNEKKKKEILDINVRVFHLNYVLYLPHSNSCKPTGNIVKCCTKYVVLEAAKKRRSKKSLNCCSFYTSISVALNI